jgi:hypothetical protein
VSTDQSRIGLKFKKIQAYLSELKHCLLKHPGAEHVMAHVLGALNLHGLKAVWVVANALSLQIGPLWFSSSISLAPRISTSRMAEGYGNAGFRQDFSELLAPIHGHLKLESSRWHKPQADLANWLGNAKHFFVSNSQRGFERHISQGWAPAAGGQ